MQSPTVDRAVWRDNGNHSWHESIRVDSSEGLVVRRVPHFTLTLNAFLNSLWHVAHIDCGSSRASLREARYVSNLHSAFETLDRGYAMVWIWHTHVNHGVFDIRKVPQGRLGRSMLERCLLEGTLAKWDAI